MVQKLKGKVFVNLDSQKTAVELPETAESLQIETEMGTLSLYLHQDHITISGHGELVVLGSSSVNTVNITVRDYWKDLKLINCLRGEVNALREDLYRAQEIGMKTDRLAEILNQFYEKIGR